MGEPDDVPAPTEHSITFSAAELSALTRLLRLPEIPGAHVAAPSADALVAAQRSLRARGVLGDPGELGDPGQPSRGSHATVATAVADLLLIAAAPQAVVEVTVTRDGQEPTHRRYAITVPAGIEHRAEDGAYRFTPFAAEEVLGRLADFAGLTAARPDPRIPVGGVTVPGDLFALALEQASQHRTASVLLAAGLTPSDAAALSEVIRDRRQVVSMRVRRAGGPGRVTGMDAHWAATGEGLVSWPAGQVATRGTGPWERPEEPLTIRPLDIGEVLAEAAAAVVGAGSADPRAAAVRG